MALTWNGWGWCQASHQKWSVGWGQTATSTCVFGPGIHQPANVGFQTMKGDCKVRVYRVILEAQLLHEKHLLVATRLLLSRIQETIDELPPSRICWSHFHPTNGTLINALKMTYTWSLHVECQKSIWTSVDVTADSQVQISVPQHHPRTADSRGYLIKIKIYSKELIKESFS